MISLAIFFPSSPMVAATKLRPTASPIALLVICTQRFQRGRMALAPVKALVRRNFSSTKLLPSALAALSTAVQRKYVLTSFSFEGWATSLSMPLKNPGTRTLMACTSGAPSSAK